MVSMIYLVNVEFQFNIILQARRIRVRKNSLYLSCLLFLFLIFLTFCSPERGDMEKRPAEGEINFSTLKAQFPFRGKIVFQSDMDGDNEIYLMTEFKLRKLTDNHWDDEYPRWSPDGTRVAFAANPHGHFDVFFMNEDGSDITRLTNFPGDETEPAWVPHAQEIVFTRETKNGWGRHFSLWKLDLEARKFGRLLPEFENSHGLAQFSPAAPLMLFTGKRMFGWDVFIHDFRTDESRSLTKGGRSCRAYFSPDGQTVAYVTSEADGKGDIWTMKPDGTEKTKLTERDETYDYFPSWSPDGKYIVFCSSFQDTPRKGPWSIFVVKVSTKSVFLLFASSGRDLFPDWK